MSLYDDGYEYSDYERLVERWKQLNIDNFLLGVYGDEKLQDEFDEYED